MYDLSEYKPWAGAVDTWNRINDEGIAMMPLKDLLMNSIQRVSVKLNSIPFYGLKRNWDI